jgi:hypothetical protein
MHILKKRAWLGVFLTALLLTGCNLPSPGPAPTATQSSIATPVFGNTPIFGNTPLIPATATPSATVMGTGEATQEGTDTTPGLPEPPRETPQETPQDEGTKSAPTPERTRYDAPDVTPTPTLTPPPPSPTRVVAGQPADRPGAMLYAAFLEEAPVIDGNLAEWSLAGHKATKVSYQIAGWPGQETLAFHYRIGWDEDYLYLACDVTDAHFSQEATGDQIFKGDGVELLLDANFDADFDVNALTADDFQIGFTAGNGSPGIAMQNYLWYPGYKSGVQADILLAGNPTDTGYTIEAAIPWSTFGVTPETDAVFGFVLSLHNNDQPGQQLQAIISTAPVRKLTDPTTWGSLILKK